MNIYRKLYGHRWQFPGGAESSYSYIVKKIQNNDTLTDSQKNELIEDITYMAGHILSDVDGMIRRDYSSAVSSGIKYLKFDLFKRPSRLIDFLFGGDFKSVYATSCLEHLQSLSNLRGRIHSTAKRILKDETNVL